MPWIALRRLSHRPLFAVVLVSVLAISLHTLVLSRPQPPFQVVLESVDLDVDLLESDPPPQEQNPLGKHTLTPDGFLVVNPDGPHPIFQLIRDAEAAWDAKLARASKTLEEAVAEYRRRYRRAPPLGFDKWCAIVN